MKQLLKPGIYLVFSWILTKAFSIVKSVSPNVNKTSLVCFKFGVKSHLTNIFFIKNIKKLENLKFTQRRMKFGQKNMINNGDTEASHKQI